MKTAVLTLRKNFSRPLEKLRMQPSAELWRSTEGHRQGIQVSNFSHIEKRAGKMAEAGWTKKGATLSDKSARTEFGLTQEEIIEAIRAGTLQFRTNYMHGNPYFRLLRSEVEALVEEKHGTNYLKKKKLKTEFTQINRELKRLRAAVAGLEKRKAELLEKIGE